MTVGEIYEMGRLDRRLTAMVRGRFYQEQSKQAKQAQQGNGL